MTGEQVRGVVSDYARALGLSGILPVENGKPLEHVHWMCLRVDELIRETQFSKADRWLGFIQGVLWAYEIYSVPTLRTHNRSSDEQKSARQNALRYLLSSLHLAVWPSSGGSDVDVAEDDGLLVITVRQPEDNFRQYWLEVRAIKEIAPTDAY